MQTQMEFMIILIIIIDDIREMTYHPRYSHISFVGAVQ